MRQKAGQLMAFDPSTPDREAQKALKVRLCRQMAELPKAQPQGMPSGRTSKLEPPANDLLAIHPACSGERHHQPCQRPHERKLGDQTMDDIDKEPREERSCGRSQTLLYNPKRRHSTIGYLSPMEFELQAGLA
jgi:hypothetical protein